MLGHWSQFVSNLSTDIRGHESLHHHQQQEFAMQYKCQYCCDCKGKGDGMWKRCLCIIFWFTRRSCVEKNAIYWWWLSLLSHLHSSPPPPPPPPAFFLPIAPFKNASKVCTVNFPIHCHRRPLRRKYAREAKTAKGLKRCWVKVKGVNNPA